MNIENDKTLQSIAEWKRRQLEQYEYDHLDNGKGGIDDVGIQEVERMEGKEDEI